MAFNHNYDSFALKYYFEETLTSQLKFSLYISAAAEAFKLAEAAICDLKIIFTPLLLGDKLAVDFLICNLMSKM